MPSSPMRRNQDSPAPALITNKYTDRTLPFLRLVLTLIMTGVYLYSVPLRNAHYIQLILIIFYAGLTLFFSPLREYIGKSFFLAVALDQAVIVLFCNATGGLSSPYIYLFILPVLVNTINTKYPFLIWTMFSTAFCLTILGFISKTSLTLIINPISAIIIVGFFFKILLDKDLHILSRYAIKDGLTGLYTQRYFYEQLRLLINSNRSVISLIIIDLNEFKRLNDEKGHLEGDRVLKEVAQAIKSSVRENDLVARYGGDEFAVILPGVSRELCAAKTEQIRHSIKSLGYFSDVAIGSANYPEDAHTIDNLVEIADKRMYLQKRKQHNRKFIQRLRD